MKVAVHGYHAGIRPGCAFVLEWNLPFRNPGSATGYSIIIMPIVWRPDGVMDTSL